MHKGIGIEVIGQVINHYFREGTESDSCDQAGKGVGDCEIGVCDGVDGYNKGERRASGKGIHGDYGGEDERSVCVGLHVRDVGGESGDAGAVLAQRIGVCLDERRLRQRHLRLREDMSSQQ